MKKIFVICLIGCGMGCGEAAYVYDCTCAGTCDGVDQAVTSQACSVESEAQKGIDKAVAECKAQLEQSCVVAGCACSCIRSGTTC